MSRSWTTAALAGWPMLYGTVAMASLWLATALLARWPWRIDAPLIWPALLTAVFLAWTQVLAWMPYGMRGLRVFAAVLWLTALDVAVILARPRGWRLETGPMGPWPRVCMAWSVNSRSLEGVEERDGSVGNWLIDGLPDS